MDSCKFKVPSSTYLCIPLLSLYCIWSCQMLMLISSFFGLWIKYFTFRGSIHGIHGEVFIGKSPVNAMTTFSGGHGPRFDGNSILLKREKDYVFVGDET